MSQDRSSCNRPAPPTHAGAIKLVVDSASRLRIGRVDRPTMALSRYRRTVLRAHPSSAAMRFAPSPCACISSIGSISSDLTITSSPSSSCPDTRWPNHRSYMLTSLHNLRRSRSNPHVAKGVQITLSPNSTMAAVRGCPGTWLCEPSSRKRQPTRSRGKNARSPRRARSRPSQLNIEYSDGLRNS
jgi:hypothetical protein